MSEVFKALSDSSRRQILQLLKDGPMTAGEIGRHLPIAKNTLSGHFTVLKSAGLVTADRRGTSMIYRLNTSVLEEALLQFIKAVDLLPSMSRSSKKDALR